MSFNQYSLTHSFSLALFITTRCCWIVLSNNGSWCWVVVDFDTNQLCSEFARIQQPGSKCNDRGLPESTCNDQQCPCLGLIRNDKLNRGGVAYRHSRQWCLFACSHIQSVTTLYITHVYIEGRQERDVLEQWRENRRRRKENHRSVPSTSAQYAILEF